MKKVRVFYPVLSALITVILSVFLYGIGDIEQIPVVLMAGSTGCMMIFLGYLSWRCYLQASSLFYSILIGTIALMMPFLGAYWLEFNEIIYGMCVVIIVLAPTYAVFLSHVLFAKLISHRWLFVAVNCISWIMFAAGLYIWTGVYASDGLSIMALLFGESLVMAIAMGRDKKTQWGAWIACVGAVFMIILSRHEAGWQWIQSMYWQKALLLCAPLLYTMLFRHLWKRAGTQSPSFMVTTYFGACILLYVFTNGIIYWGYGDMAWAPDTYIYLFLLSLMVFFDEKRLTAEKHLGMEYTIPAIMVYSIICVGITVLGNARLREIIYHFGGPAIKIQTSTRVDWVGYRLAALKTFLTGDSSFIRAVSGDPYGESYGYFVYGNSFRPFLFQNGRWMLVLFIVSISAIAIMLLRIRWDDPGADRIKNYFAFSYLIRMGIAIVMFVFMFLSSAISFPFIITNLMDMMVLVLLIVEDDRKGMEIKEVMVDEQI